MTNKSVKLFYIWGSGSGVVVKRDLLSRALAAPLFGGIILNLDQWFRRGWCIMIFLI